jgi:hypothetical protein
MSAYRRSQLILSVLALAGLISVIVAWRSVADVLAVSIQLPYAVSGALGGLALLGFALGLISIQAARRAEANEREQYGRLVTASADLLAIVRRGTRA